MTRYHYSIADFIVTIESGGDVNPERMLPSFAKFAVDEEGANAGERLLTLVVEAGKVSPPDSEKPKWTHEVHNDFGDLVISSREPGALEVRFKCDGTDAALLQTDTTFSHGLMTFDPAAGHLARMLSTMVYLMYSQAILGRGAMGMHSSVVVKDGKAFMFLGPSGTGKSTHSRLWLKAFPGTRLLNDDNPVVRLAPDGTATAWGTPWSGKTICYVNRSAPVQAIVRLRQGTENIFTHLEGVGAFVALLPSCSALRNVAGLSDSLHDNIIKLCQRVATGELQCRPDLEAALICNQETDTLT